MTTTQNKITYLTYHEIFELDARIQREMHERMIAKYSKSTLIKQHCFDNDLTCVEASLAPYALEDLNGLPTLKD